MVADTQTLPPCCSSRVPGKLKSLHVCQRTSFRQCPTLFISRRATRRGLTKPLARVLGPAHQSSARYFCKCPLMMASISLTKGHCGRFSFARPDVPREDIEEMSDQHRASTIPDFCLNNGISLSHYHSLKRQGLGPREMLVGNLIRISSEAEREWTERMEALAASPEGKKRSAERHAKMVRAGKLAAQSPKHVSKQGPRKSVRRGVPNYA